MNMEEKLDLILNEMQGMKEEMQGMKEDIKKIQFNQEHNIMPRVQILLENHSDLAKNIMAARGVDERVGVLEFEVKVIKKQLESLIS